MTAANGVNATRDAGAMASTTGSEGGECVPFHAMTQPAPDAAPTTPGECPSWGYPSRTAGESSRAAVYRSTSTTGGDR